MTSMPQVGAFGVNVPYESGYRDQRGDERENATVAYMRSRDQAQDQMAFQKDMSNTSWQRGVADMQAAGINPMLAVSQGGASSPQGAGFAAKKADTPQMPGVGGSIQLQTAAQVEHLYAQADKERAEADNIRGVDRDYKRQQTVNLKQEVAESAMRIEKIIAETDTQQASAAHIKQQITNLKESVPHIRQTIKLLQEQTGEVKQRISARLPQLQRALGDLETIVRQMEMPGRQVDESYHTTRGGAILRAIGNALRSLNPMLPSTSSHNFGSSINR